MPLNLIQYKVCCTSLDGKQNEIVIRSNNINTITSNNISNEQKAASTFSFSIHCELRQTHYALLLLYVTMLYKLLSRRQL